MGLLNGGRYPGLLDLIDMYSLRRLLIHHRSISWLLVAAILFVTFLPAHYHLHHVFSEDSVAHDHSIDFHLLTDATAESHHDEHATIVEATPDGIVKNKSSAFLPFILLATLLLILPVVYKRIRIRRDHSHATPYQSFHHLSPPLRAPPLV